jgi:hypothetical protein
MKQRPSLIIKSVIIVLITLFFVCACAIVIDTTRNKPEATSPAYGKTGPAGGLIFYDKKNNKDGWRYLEAAPIDGDFQAVFCSQQIDLMKTKLGFGDGQENTRIIVEILSGMTGEWDKAAQKCDEFELNGYDDWFMPSWYELEWIRRILKVRGLGDFRNAIYWSSSSSESPYNRVAVVDFTNGDLSSVSPTQSYYVRPIRKVSENDAQF